MSSYNARRAPNVSRYLANLNTSPQDITAQQAPLGLVDDSLDFLTNTEFFDFDQFNPAAAAAFGQQGVQNDAFANGFDFHAFQHNNMTSPSTMPPSPQNGLANGYVPQPQHYAASPVTGDDQRKASIVGGMPKAGANDMEDMSRMAAEEDKRRRNTAASARFRVKKKQREQALEKQTKEMSDKVLALENKVTQLEMENKWLKSLITEKTEGVKVVVDDKKLDEESEERSTDNRTKGVGTAVEAGEA